MLRSGRNSTLSPNMATSFSLLDSNETNSSAVDVHNTSSGTDSGLTGDGGSLDHLEHAFYRMYVEWGNTLVSLAVLGVAGNLVALLVWCAERVYNATTFLFKYLAVWDSLYLALFASFVVCIQLSVNANPLAFMANSAQLVSAHTTLLAAITRWLAVFKPLHARTLLTPRRVIITCVCLLLWCLLLENTLHVVMEYGDVQISGSSKMAAIYSKMVIGLVIPLLLLLVFNVALVLTAYKRRKASYILRPHSTLRQSSGRLTLAVVCMSVTCLLAYPVAVVVQMYQAFRCFGPGSSRTSCDFSQFEDLTVASCILQILNSSVNVIYYCAFASHFRQLLVKRVHACLPYWPGCGRHSPDGNHLAATMSNPPPQ